MPIPPSRRQVLATHHTPHRPDVKVCGITREQDILACLAGGVRYLGVNRHAPSPRCVPEEAVPALLAKIPAGRRVYVAVAPELPDLAAADRQGFDFFQLHFDPLSVPEKRVALWSECVGRDRLWPAPRLAGGSGFPSPLMKYAAAFLIDGYSPAAYGGTGKTADWAGVAALKSMHSDKTWIVAGGLNPDNVVDAERASHADILDLNSGIEDAPGIKNAQKLAEALARLNAAFPASAPQTKPATAAPASGAVKGMKVAKGAPPPRKPDNKLKLNP